MVINPVSLSCVMQKIFAGIENYFSIKWTKYTQQLTKLDTWPCSWSNFQLIKKSYETISIKNILNVHIY